VLEHLADRADDRKCANVRDRRKRRLFSAQEVAHCDEPVCEPASDRTLALGGRSAERLGIGGDQQHETGLVEAKFEQFGNVRVRRGGVLARGGRSDREDTLKYSVRGIVHGRQEAVLLICEVLVERGACNAGTMDDVAQRQRREPPLGPKLDRRAEQPRPLRGRNLLPAQAVAPLRKRSDRRDSSDDSSFSELDSP
jgi:hypothetical protein